MPSVLAVICGIANLGFAWMDTKKENIGREIPMKLSLCHLCLYEQHLWASEMKERDQSKKRYPSATCS